MAEDGWRPVQRDRSDREELRVPGQTPASEDVGFVDTGEQAKAAVAPGPEQACCCSAR